MWRCVARENSGVILADDMGLGKTLTSIALVYCCLVHGLCKKVVIVCPSSLVDTWNKEFLKWLPFTLSARAQSPHRKVSVLRGGGERDFCSLATPVLIASYETFRKHSAAISAESSNEEARMVICDEAHRLKAGDGSKTVEGLQLFTTARRVLLTGTPLQNNLSELHAMVSFARPSALPSLARFRALFAAPIDRSRDRDASDAERGDGQRAAEQLRAVLDQFVLRRSSGDVRQSLPDRNDYVSTAPQSLDLQSA
jgi:SNF2 family DNA or RNA helicase